MHQNLTQLDNFLKNRDFENDMKSKSFHIT